MASCYCKAWCHCQPGKFLKDGDDGEKFALSQVQKIPNLAYQIYQTLQIYWVYEKDYIKYKYDRKWKTENMAEKHNFQV